MRLAQPDFRRRIARYGAAGLLVVSGLACAQTKLPECSSLFENRSACQSTFWTYPGPGGTGVPSSTIPSTYAPPTVRVRPHYDITVVVHKRPLETVQLTKAAYTQQAKPDPLGVIVSQLSKPLGGLGISSTLTPNPDTVRIQLDAVAHDVELTESRPGAPQVPQPDQVVALQSLVTDLKTFRENQDQVAAELSIEKKTLADLTQEVSAAQRFNPAVDSNSGDWSNRANFTGCLQHITRRLAAQTPDLAQATLCGTTNDTLTRNLALEALPTQEITLLKVEIADLSQRLRDIQSSWERANLAPNVRSAYAAEFSEANLSGYRKQIDRLVDRQARLEDELKTAQTATAPIIAYKQALAPVQATLAGCIESMTDDCAALVVKRITLRRYEAEKSIDTGQQGVVATLTTQTALTKESADVGTVAATWIHQPIEVSGGVMWSSVLGHTFQNSPIITAGVPQLDSSGKAVTEVTKTTSSPTIDAVVLVHYRFFEMPGLFSRRFAVLGTLGVGTGTSSSVDGVAGVSFAFGNFFLSPLLDFTRDTRLIGGVQVGDKLGSQPPAPPTEKYWVHKLGIAFTYAIPVTS